MEAVQTVSNCRDRRGGGGGGGDADAYTTSHGLLLTNIHNVVNVEATPQLLPCSGQLLKPVRALTSQHNLSCVARDTVQIQGPTYGISSVRLLLFVFALGYKVFGL